MIDDMPGIDGNSGPDPGSSNSDVMFGDSSRDSSSTESGMTSAVGFVSCGIEEAGATSGGTGCVPEGSRTLDVSSVEDDDVG